ncbi:MAG: hypothetical protein HY321_13965 [Armatimonadetes bacterium]|nr:hypothetical protein [Armatimonadota bacterium]
MLTQIPSTVRAPRAGDGTAPPGAPAASPDREQAGSARQTDGASPEWSRCPHLGRRHHPREAYPYPSGHNVCFAQPRAANHPYSRVARGIQAACCLNAGTAGWAACSAAARAAAGETAPPSTLPLRARAPRLARRARRRGRRHRERWLRLGRRALLALTIVALCWGIGTAVAVYVEGGAP